MRMYSLPCFQIWPYLSFSGIAKLGEVSPGFESGEIAELFLLSSRLFAGDGRLLFGGGFFGLGIFLAGFLRICFGGFISHDVYLSLPRLTRPRNRSFPEGTLKMGDEAIFVNAGF